MHLGCKPLSQKSVSSFPLMSFTRLTHGLFIMFKNKILSTPQWTCPYPSSQLTPPTSYPPVALPYRHQQKVKFAFASSAATTDERASQTDRQLPRPPCEGPHAARRTQPFRVRADLAGVAPQRSATRGCTDRKTTRGPDA